jgi:hypothetical protein
MGLDGVSFTNKSSTVLTKPFNFQRVCTDAIPAIGREGWNVLAMLQTSLYLLCVPSCGVNYQLSTHPLLPRYTTPQWADCNYNPHAAYCVTL